MKAAAWAGKALLMLCLPALVVAQIRPNEVVSDGIRAKVIPANVIPANLIPANVIAAYAMTADVIPAPLTGTPGDAARGRGIVANRQVGLCLLCHNGPLPEERFQGNLAPSLAGAGSRWSEGQLRLRLTDSKKLNPDTIMPAYYATSGLTRVAKNLQGQPLLAAQQIEDVIAYLMTLKQ